MIRARVAATRQLSLGADCNSWFAATCAAQVLLSPTLLPALVAHAAAHSAEASSPSPLRPWCELTRDAPSILRRCSAVLADHARRRRRRWELRGDGGGGGVGGDADGAGTACQPLSKEEQAEAETATAAHSLCRCVLAVLARVLIVQLPGSGRHAVWPLAFGDGGEGEEDSGGGGSGGGAVAAARPPGPWDWDDLWAAVAAVGGCGELKSLALLALAVVEARRCIARADTDAGDAARARLLLDQLWGIMQEEAARVAAAQYPDLRTASEKATERGARLAAARDVVRSTSKARKAAVRREIAEMSQALPSQSRQMLHRREQQQHQQQQLEQLEQRLTKVLLQQRQQHVDVWNALIQEVDRAKEEEDEDEEEEEEEEQQQQEEEAEEEGGVDAVCGRGNEQGECDRWARLFAASPALIAALRPRIVFTCSACFGEGPPSGPGGAWVDPAMNGRLTAMARTPGVASPGGGLACWLAAAADAIEAVHADCEAVGVGECRVCYDPLVPSGWLPAAPAAGAQRGQGKALRQRPACPRAGSGGAARSAARRRQTARSCGAARGVAP
jgi:hypothetical protein